MHKCCDIVRCTCCSKSVYITENGEQRTENGEITSARSLYFEVHPQRLTVMVQQEWDGAAGIGVDLLRVPCNCYS